MTDTVLVVEDDAILASAVRYNLERDGYACLLATDGARAIDLARRERPALILLDLMLPGIDGVEVCRRIRADSTVPIIMLTARVEEVDRVVGLEVGADDYLSKPFSMRESFSRGCTRRCGVRRCSPMWWSCARSLLETCRLTRRGARSGVTVRYCRSSQKSTSFCTSSREIRGASSAGTSCSSRSGATISPAAAAPSTFTCTGYEKRSKSTPLVPSISGHHAESATCSTLPSAKRPTCPRFASA